MNLPAPGVNIHSGRFYFRHTSRWGRGENTKDEVERLKDEKFNLQTFQPSNTPKFLILPSAFHNGGALVCDNFYYHRYAYDNYYYHKH